MSASHHGGDPARSHRLREVLSYLSLCGRTGATTAELAEVTGSIATATDVADLRKSGADIRCEYLHRTADGAKVYQYRLVRSPRRAA